MLKVYQKGPSKTETHGRWMNTSLELERTESGVHADMLKNVEFPAVI